MSVFPYPKAFQFGLASLDERTKHIIFCGIPDRLRVKIKIGTRICFQDP